jgi:hypothetical protein
VDPAGIVFAFYGLGCQVLLALFFATQRWSPRLADWLGWIAYSFSSVGLPLGGSFLLGGQSWRLYLGPLLFALWGGFAVVADLWPRLRWRTSPRRRVLVPYIALYLGGQLLLWWPLWDLWRSGWYLYAALFVTTSALGLQKMMTDARAPDSPTV